MRLLKVVVYQMLIVVIMFLPAIFFFGVKSMLAPDGFWQNFVR